MINTVFVKENESSFEGSPDPGTVSDGKKEQNKRNTLLQACCCLLVYFSEHLGGFDETDPVFQLLLECCQMESPDGRLQGPRVHVDPADIEHLLQEFPLNLRGEIPFADQIKCHLKSVTEADQLRIAGEKVGTWYRNRLQLLLNIKTLHYLIVECGWSQFDQRNKKQLMATGKAIREVAKRLGIEKNYIANVRSLQEQSSVKCLQIVESFSRNQVYEPRVDRKQEYNSNSIFDPTLRANPSIGLLENKVQLLVSFVRMNFVQ